MRLLCIGMLAFAAGCCFGAPPTASPPPLATAPVASSAVEAQAPVAAPTAPTGTSSVHYAAYEGDNLDVCMSVTIALRAPSTFEGDLQADADTRIAGISLPNEEDQTGSLIRLAAPCEEQFAGRVELARCVRENDTTTDGVTRQLRFVTMYYLFESSLEDDAQERRCLSDGGRWSEVAEDSLEHAAAEMDAVQRRVRRRRR